MKSAVTSTDSDQYGIDCEGDAGRREIRLELSPVGRRYTALYAAYSPEVVRLMFTDRALRGAILHGLLLWQPNVAAIADGRGAAVTITADQARAVDLVLDRLAEAGSPGLRKAIAEERRAHARTPGFNLAQAILREIGNKDRRPLIGLTMSMLNDLRAFAGSRHFLAQEGSGRPGG